MSLRSLTSRLVRAWFEFHPQLATEKGYPGLNAWSPDYSFARVERFRHQIARLELELKGFKCSELHYRLLKRHLQAVVLPFEGGGPLTSCPVFYLKAGLDSLESLRLRTEPIDWASFGARLQGLQGLLRVARLQLVRTTSPSHETALEMVEEAISDFGSLRSSLPAGVAEVSEETRRRLDDFHGWLDGRPPEPFKPMGAERFGALLAGEHGLSDWRSWQQGADQALEGLEQALAATRSPASGGTGRLTREELWGFFESELERVRRFVEEAQIVTMPPGELRLCQTPAYLRALIPGAFYLEPAVFAKERVGRFYLPPFPEEWSDEVMARYRARKEAGGFANLVVHEAWPGHHLHFLHAATHHHPLRNLRDNDLTVEGWALYCEELLDDLGLHRQSPFPPRLRSLHMRVLRVLVDIGIHTGEMTLEEAEAFMLKRLDLRAASDWVSREVRRYALEPGQALSYWVGAQLILRLREELGVEAENFRSFHDELLSYGPIPLPLICEQMRAHWRALR